MYFMLRTNTGSAPRPAPRRSGTRPWPLLAMALLGAAGICALHPTGATAQKAAPAQPRAGAIATPIGSPVTPVTPVIPFNVSTYRYDNSRSGVNTGETLLTPTSIAQTNSPTTGLPTKIPFGKLFTRQLDGPSYGQPLYYSNLSLTSSYTGAVSTHNVVIVATNNNTIYAFDADSNKGSNSGALWSVNFNSVPNGIGPTSGNDIVDVFGLPQADIQPLIGIVGTPVIDPATRVMYVVVRTTEGSSYAHRLHAIDISTGLEKSYSPQLIGQQVDVFGDLSPVIVPGTGDDPYDANNIFFDTATQLQRPALALTTDSATATKTVHVAYGGFENSPPYHGWVFAFDASTLNPQSVFCTTPNEANTFVPGDFIRTGGIDMSGVGPAADATGLYFSAGVGNSSRRAASNGESVLKLRLAPEGIGPAFPYQTVPVVLPQPNVLGVFTPYNIDVLNTNGLDLGTGGVALLPQNVIAGHPHTMVTAGIEGKIYLLDVDGIYATSQFADTPATGAIATFPGLLLGPAYGVPAVYTSTLGTTVYFHATGDVLRPFTVSANAPYLTPNALTGSQQFGFPGAMPVISANGTNNASAIIWELESRLTAPGFNNPNPPPSAVLHAYNAATLVEIFNSTANGGGTTNIGDYVTFSQPLVANGKVFVAAGTSTPSGSLTSPTTGVLTVFGLLPATAPPTTQGRHYLITGPLLLAGFEFVNANRNNYYSITAVDADYNPVVVNNATVTMSLTNTARGRKLSFGSVTFSNQSTVIFSRAVTTETFGLGFGANFYSLQGFDGSGNSSNIATLGVFSSFSSSGVFDHYNIRVAPAARNGGTTTVSVTAVDQNGYPVPYTSTVTIYDTLPNSAQAAFAYEVQGGFAYSSLQGGSGTFPIVLNGVGQHIIVVDDASGIATTALVNVVSGGGGGAAPIAGSAAVSSRRP